MFRIQKLLNIEQQLTSIKLPRKRMKIQHEVYLCRECGHLYFYRVVKCPLCESVSVGIVKKDVVTK